MTIAIAAPVAPRAYATIALSRHQSAEGPVLRRYLDGRVVIDSGAGPMTGRPLTPAPGPAPVRALFGRLF